MASTRSLSFNGSTGYVSATNPAVSLPFSISLWFKVSGTTLQTLFSIGTSGSDGGWYRVTARGDASNVLSAQQSEDLGSSSLATTSTSYTDNVWAHVLAVFASTTSRKIYLNGGGLGTDANPLPAPAAVNVTGIGRLSRATPVHYANGLIDDVAVLPGDQSAQAAGLAAGSVDPASLSPLALWRLEEGTGTSTADGSGNGLTGTLNGGVSWSTDVAAALVATGNRRRRLLCGAAA